MTTRRSDGSPKTTGMDSVRAMMRGLGEIMDRLGQLADKGAADFSGTGNLGDAAGGDKGWKGVYGFSVKVGRGGDGVRVEPFGNLRRDRQTGEAAVHEVREPVTDVFEEPGGILIVAEMPGVSAAEVKLELAGDVLTLKAAAGDKRYSKELLLPRPFKTEQATLKCNNGVVEIWLRDQVTP
ncbi:MAG TPA: Hsp20/alpha crystallin family protein [Pseudomonadota bacterium]|nr:Hsp20/alpha crystallin family protein [Pseudomonadota bacterium]